MKKNLIYVVLCGVIILSNACSTEKGRFSKETGIKYDTVYALPAIGTSGNYTFTTQTNDIIIDVKENQSGLYEGIGLSGSDGVNYFHEGKGIWIEEFLGHMFIHISDKNFVIREEHPSENIDIYVETLYKRGSSLESRVVHEEILEQLSILFDFTITTEILPNTVYTFTVKDMAKAQSHFIKLPRGYKAVSGYSDFNVNEEKNEYYCTFSQFLENRKNKGNFQYIDNTGLEGVFAVPYSGDMNKFMGMCHLWGIEVTETIEEQETLVLTFNG